MPDLLLEFFSEEIPARMQAKAAEDLRALVTGRLVDAGLVYDGAKAFATPRRLALSVQGIPERQPDLKEEKKGPRVGAPPGAIQGFLKSAGLSSLDQARVERDPRKGDFYVALIEKPGRPAIDVLAEILPVIARTFPWPKSMRWGAASARPGSLSWVRPLQSIVATFGPETQDPDIVAFALDGVAASDHTHGHRFLAPRRFKVRRLSDYMAALEKHKVVLDAERRQNMILADARTLAFAKGYALVEDEGLLAEVAGLVEWPVVLMGTFDASFLGIPEEVIRATIRANQKCFVLRDEGNGKLVNKFILVSNIEASDSGRAVVGGNERVIRARLSDAKFFYETDLKAWREVPLDTRLKTFDGIVFHDKLGSQGARIRRIENLAATLAPLVGADAAKVRRAARLCKADLLTEVVGEFPELQGMMGADYARATGEDEAVARACEEHYRPKGPDDLVPGDPVSVAVALADKIDTLVGFWAINEKPTGSKDPFALRRAALGVLRILLAARLPLVLRHVFENHAKTAFDRDDKALIDDLAAFFEDRLVVQLRDQKVRNGVVSAVLEAASLVAGQELLAIVDRVEALGKFLDTDDGRNLLAGYKRAANILAIEEKRDKTTYGGAADGGLYRQAEEWALAKAIETARQEASAALAREDVTAAMAAMAALRPPVDAFFDKVTVNADDRDVRANRLRLLGEIRAVTGVVADFSRIEG